MNEEYVDVIESMRSSLLSRVSEWVGFDYPEKGEEDYDKWRSMLVEIGEIADLDGIRGFLESNGMGNFEDFLTDGDWELTDGED